MRLKWTNVTRLSRALLVVFARKLSAIRAMIRFSERSSARSTIGSSHLPKKAKMRQRKYEDEKLAEAQKESISNSKLLKEDLSDTYMTGNPNRRVPYNFKGFSPEEKQRILDQQMRQIKEKEERANKQLEEKFEYDRQQEMYRRQLVLLEREKIAEQQKEAQRLAAFHQSQKLERNIQKRNLTQEVYQNAVSPDFYNRFAEINVQNQRP
mmetsp:Transcript_18985/g.30177  ORF Transcript_18985/g.30177 Transcript_18985/m.30177 type:complete len:209 (-) Transcript_18985:169-795(-)